jgi:hypothetical protein
MTRKMFEVKVETTYRIAVDERLTPDDEWRSRFYNYHTLADMAGHIVWNRYVMGFKYIEGIPTEDHDKFEFVYGPGKAITNVVEVQ